RQVAGELHLPRQPDRLEEIAAVAMDVDALDAGELLAECLFVVDVLADDEDAGVCLDVRQGGVVLHGAQVDFENRAVLNGTDGRREAALETFQQRAEAAPGAPGLLPDRPPPVAPLLPLVPLQPAPQQ